MQDLLEHMTGELPTLHSLPVEIRVSPEFMEFLRRRSGMHFPKCHGVPCVYSYTLNKHFEYSFG